MVETPDGKSSRRKAFEWALYALAGPAGVTVAIKREAINWPHSPIAYAYHEAAHCLAAYLVRWQPYQLTIVPEEITDRHGRTVTAGGSCSASPRPVKDVSSFTHSKDTDRRIAVMWCSLLTPQWGWQSTRRLVRQLEKQAEEMLNEKWDLLDRLAEELFNKKVLDQAAIEAVLTGQEQASPALLEFLAQPQGAEQFERWVN